MEVNFKDMRYAYMVCCYLEQGAPSVYELVLSNEDFSQVYLYRTDLQGLNLFTEQCSTNYLFTPEGFLKCKPLSSVPIVPNVKIGQVFDLSSNNEFHTAILNCLDNDCIYVDDSIIDCSEYIGTAINHFKTLRFSETTMSVYFTLTMNDGICNRQLIRMEDDDLKVIPFYLGVPATSAFVPDFGKFLKYMIINRVKYAVYKVNFLQLKVGPVVSTPLLHKTSILSVRYNSYLNTLSALIDMQSQFVKGAQSSLPWVGSSNNYASDYGCYLTTTLPKVSPKRAVELVNLATSSFYKLFKEQGADAAFNAIKRDRFNATERECLVIIGSVIYNNEEIVEQLQYAIDLKTYYQKEYVRCASYVYTLRATSYLFNCHLGDKNGIITGSDESSSVMIGGILNVF